MSKSVRRIGPVLLGSCLLMAAWPPLPPVRAEDPAPRQAARDDLKKLQGEWVCVAMEREGDEIPAEAVKSWSATYEADQVTLMRDHGPVRRGITTLDPSKKPKAMNTWDSDGPYADQTVPGIYELDGDTLKVCFARPGEDRPTGFTTRQGTGFVFAVYKRKKP